MRRLGAAEAVREGYRQDLPEEYWSDEARLQLLLRERLGEATFAEAWREGRSMPPQQILEEMYVAETGTL